MQEADRLEQENRLLREMLRLERLKKYGPKSEKLSEDLALDHSHEVVFESLMRAAGRCVEDTGRFWLYECFIDGTFSKAKGGGDGIGCTRVGKGVKIMILVDAKGLPVAACSTPANPAESHLIQQLFGYDCSEHTGQSHR